MTIESSMHRRPLPPAEDRAARRGLAHFARRANRAPRALARGPHRGIGGGAQACHNRAMRRTLLALLALAATLPGFATADQTDGRLPELFERLKAELSDDEA